MTLQKSVLGYLAFIPLLLALNVSEVKAATCAGDNFDAAAYLARYQDLRDAGIGLSGACSHYENYGQREGRNGAPEFGSSSTSTESNCDLSIVSHSYASKVISLELYSSMAHLSPYDVEIIAGSKKLTWKDLPHSSSEPLKVPNADVSGDISVKVSSVGMPGCYVLKNLSIAGAIVVSPVVPTKCNGDIFDADTYLARYKDLRDAGLKKKNACKHYKLIGKYEGRSGAPDPDTTTGGTSGGSTSGSTSGGSTGGGSGTPTCEAGPSVTSISNVTAASLTTQFHGVNVTKINYEIQSSSGSVVRSGSINPTSSVLSLSYDSIPAGSYKLVLSGGNCSGSGSKDFVVASSGGTSGGASGGTTGGVPELAACEAGPSVSSISSITSTSLSTQFHGVNVTKVNFDIQDASGNVVRSGSVIPTSSFLGLTYDTLSAGNYKLVLKGGNCTGSGSQDFSIASSTSGGTSSGTTTGAIPGGTSGTSTGGSGELAACKAGPTIISISEISVNGLKALFNGEDIYGIDYEVLNGSGSKVAFGSFVPKNNQPLISFSLAAGNYKLYFKGSLCKGESNKDFTIPAIPPVIVVPYPPEDPEVIDPIVTGNIVPRNMGRGLPEHMDIVISGSSENWIINDRSTLTPPGGYDFHYIVNGQIIRQSGPLRNFSWPSNNEVGIFKSQMKQGIDTFNKWECPTNGYYVCDAGATFSYNTSVAFSNFVFSDSGAGNYNPETRRVQWMDLIGDFNDITHGVWFVTVGRLSSPESLLRKGVTHFSNREFAHRSDRQTHLDAGRFYNDVEILPSQLSLPDRGGSNWVPAGQYWPNVWNTRFFEATSGAPLTPEQGKQKGEQYSIDSTLMVFENTEQDHAVGEHWPFWKEYYKALNTRMQERWGSKGIPYFIAHNYFTTFGGDPYTLGYGGKEANKAILKKPLSQWPGSNLLPGGTLEYTNATCFGVYLNAPDINMDVAYKIMFSAEVNKKANKKLLIFMQPMHEWKPNNLEEVVYPDGKFYHYVKLPHNPSQAKSYGFLSRAFASGMIFFGSNPKTDETFRLFSEFHDGRWLPNGSTEMVDAKKTNFPYWAPSSSYEVFTSSGADDMVAFGIDTYNKTFAPTRGGERKFLKFRLNGGSWVNAVNSEMDDLVDAYYDKRGVMFSQMKDGKLSVFYLNPYADNSKKSLEFEHNGKVYSMTVQSTNLYAKIINL